MATATTSKFSHTKLTGSNDTSVWSVIKSTIIMNFHVFTRYRANFIGGLLEVVILVGSFFVFSLVLDFRDPSLFRGEVQDNAMFIFFLAGLIMMFFQNTALFVPVQTVRRDLYNGTMEYVFSGPQSRYAYMVGNIIADLIISQIFFVPLLILFFGVVGWSEDSLLIILTVAVYFVVVVSVGILMSLAAILYKQINSITAIVGILIQFIGGVFLPVQTFPEPLQWLAIALPFTFAYDIVRYYAFNRTWITLFPIGTMWILMMVNAVFYFLLSRYLLVKVEKHAKKNGLHLL